MWQSQSQRQDLWQLIWQHLLVLLRPTEQAEGLRNAKAEAESAFYNYLMDGLDEPTREAFLQTLDMVYRRSKAESRAGFPHVKKAMEEAQHGAEA